MTTDNLATKEHTNNGFKYQLGDNVRKKSGSQWQGRVVGFYSTALTPNGYCVESDSHAGSVQIYPESALEICNHKKAP